MDTREDDTADTVYCPACWGAGQVYRAPVPADACSTSCGCGIPSVEELEAHTCSRCAGSGLVPAGSAR